MLSSDHSAVVTPRDLRCAAELLARLPVCDLERLAAPLRPAVAIGEAQWPTLVLLDLIDTELGRRHRG